MIILIDTYLYRYICMYCTFDLSFIFLHTELNLLWSLSTANYDDDER